MATVAPDSFLVGRQLTKRYDDIVALQDLSFTLHEGEIVCLLGPSGSGKSTLLRCVAGLEIPDAGRVLFSGTDITEVPPYRRGFGMMFQNFALFPHRNVAENVAFGLRMQGVPNGARQERVEEALDLVGLSGYGERSVFELSGGEQQRVALARSLAPRPPLLLLDEPLGALDRRLRERLVADLRTILKGVGISALYVTHDQQEAFAISDRLLLIHNGEKVQEGEPEQVYRHPVNRFAAAFFGLQNILTVLGVEADPGSSLVRVRTPLGELCTTSDGREPASLLLLRPEGAVLVDEPGENVIAGEVIRVLFRGGHYRLETQHAGGACFVWQVSAAQEAPRVGEHVYLKVLPPAMVFLREG